MLLLGLLGATVAQAELYRYVDDKGVVVLDRHGVPPQFIGRGYEVLNDQGRVTPGRAACAYGSRASTYPGGESPR